jgi:hypothetical protein
MHGIGVRTVHGGCKCAGSLVKDIPPIEQRVDTRSAPHGLESDVSLHGNVDVGAQVGCEGVAASKQATSVPYSRVCLERLGLAN